MGSILENIFIKLPDKFCILLIPVLWSSSSAAVGRGTRLRNTAPPDVLVNVGHYEQNLEALREEGEQKKEKRMRCSTHYKPSVGFLSQTSASRI